MGGLLLEYRIGEGENDFETVVLPNVLHYKYVFGSTYPEEEEVQDGFIFCRDGGEIVIQPRHCRIFTNELGHFYIESIENDTTFVNCERVETADTRRLLNGDIIALGAPNTLREWKGYGCRPIYKVIYSVAVSATISDDDITIVNGGGVESPLDNPLILSEILSYLTVADLKNARLVANKWNLEGIKVMEKKATACFDFTTHFVKPKKSMQIFRYMHEMQNVKLRQIYIHFRPTEYEEDEESLGTSNNFKQNPILFSSGEPGEKMLIDIITLLNSAPKLSKLTLNGDVWNEDDFEVFQTVIENATYEEKIEQLKLETDFFFTPSEEIVRLSTIENLKKFHHQGSIGDFWKSKWISQFVPLLPRSLQILTCWADVATLYLTELQKHQSQLKGLEIEDGVISKDTLSVLLEFNGLTSINFAYETGYSEQHNNNEQEEHVEEQPGVNCHLLEKLLFKNSSTLQRILLHISHQQEVIPINFPLQFPNLKDLEINFEGLPTTRCINWGSSSSIVNYKTQLPSLKKLKIQAPTWWSNDGPFLSSFTPQENGNANSVEQVWIRSFDVDDGHADNQLLIETGIEKLQKMFPTARLIKIV